MRYQLKNLFIIAMLPLLVHCGREEVMDRPIVADADLRQANGGLGPSDDSTVTDATTIPSYDSIQGLTMQQNDPKARGGLATNAVDHQDDTPQQQDAGNSDESEDDNSDDDSFNNGLSTTDTTLPSEDDDDHVTEKVLIGVGIGIGLAVSYAGYKIYQKHKARNAQPTDAISKPLPPQSDSRHVDSTRSR